MIHHDRDAVAGQEEHEHDLEATRIAQVRQERVHGGNWCKQDDNHGEFSNQRLGTSSCRQTFSGLRVRGSIFVPVEIRAEGGQDPFVAWRRTLHLREDWKAGM